MVKIKRATLYRPYGFIQTIILILLSFTKEELPLFQIQVPPKVELVFPSVIQTMRRTQAYMMMIMII